MPFNLTIKPTADSEITTTSDDVIHNSAQLEDIINVVKTCIPFVSSKEKPDPSSFVIKEVRIAFKKKGFELFITTTLKQCPEENLSFDVYDDMRDFLTSLIERIDVFIAEMKDSGEDSDRNITLSNIY
ncbi:hypothetical protein [Photobacterium kishitanii]|uniref:Uncharacterized protein n=1 Tax=Photobacterium kishitanii TaxID=318456 RepID=A0A2T3KLC5_9GAMM|nr:hypothetical protein [Photobacterium kishitanii]PSV00447.1 hypothetical protein C9J27_04765 [Photobacterium kishitanii]